MGEELAGRSIEFVPAFHRCSDEPSKNYGICNARMIWTLRAGPDAISWELLTGWGMPEEAFHEAAPGCKHPVHQGAWPDAPAMAGPVDWTVYERPPTGFRSRVAVDGQPCADTRTVSTEDMKLKTDSAKSVAEKDREAREAAAPAPWTAAGLTRKQWMEREKENAS